MKRYRKSASGGACSGHSLPGDFGAAVAGLVVRYCRKDSLKQRGNGLGCDVAADERPSDLVDDHEVTLPIDKHVLAAVAVREENAPGERLQKGQAFCGTHQRYP